MGNILLKILGSSTKSVQLNMINLDKMVMKMSKLEKMYHLNEALVYSIVTCGKINTLIFDAGFVQLNMNMI